MKKIKYLFKKYNELIMYVIVGILTTLISLLSFNLCIYTFLNPNDDFQLQIANVISWILSVSFAYFANRRFVFKSRNNNKFAEISKFVGSRISTLLIDMLSMYIMVSLIKIDASIAKLIVQVIVLVLNYVFSKLFVFKLKNNN